MNPTRINLIFIVIVIAFLIIFGSLIRYHIISPVGVLTVNSAALEDKGKKLKNRGDIFILDKDGRRYIAATTTFERKLILNAQNVIDAEELYEHLIEEVELDKDIFFKAAGRKNDPHVILIDKLDNDQYKRLKDRRDTFRLKGLGFEEVPVRIYPYKGLAAQTIGFLSFGDSDGDGIQEYDAAYGVEKYYDEVLSKDSGNNVYTTIDKNVQTKLEEELQGVLDKWGSQLVGGIVMDPYTGKIIAMANVPTFDLNNFKAEEDYSIFNNASVQSIYELGSVFKPLTLAIGLDTKKIDLDTTYNDTTGRLKIDGHTISNFDEKGRGYNIPLQKIISESLNTGAVFILQQIGRESFRNYFSAFEFDSLTRVDLPAEEYGRTQFDSERLIEYATAAYGHGIAVTPLAATRAFASLVNGGFVIEPYVRERDAVVKKNELPLFRKTTLDDTTDILVKAFDNSFAGIKLKNDKYRIAAKSGTALLTNKRGGYHDDRFIHSFFGYIPGTNKNSYIVLMYNVDPKIEDEDTFASDTMAEPFSNLVEYMIDYYDIDPNR